MGFLVDVTERLFDEVTPQGFDPRLVAKHPVDTGHASERVRQLSTRLNAVREGPPKNAVVVWAPPYAAITRRGPWVYVSNALSERLSDDALAFVIAHEMAHHDLLHFSPAMVATAWIGNAPRMESQADALAYRLLIKAGFDGRGALEAMEPSGWKEPEVEPAWPASLMRQHPPMKERHAALRRMVEQTAATG